MKHFILSLCAAVTFSAHVALAQISISGTITDSDNQPLPGASVVEKGTTRGVSTDMEGRYSLTVSDDATLVISFVGYASAEVNVAGRSIIDVSLESEDLEEVIIVGTRTAPRSNTDTPLPVDVLPAAELASTGQMTFDKALQYRIPSFNTVQTPVNDATALLDPYEIRNMGPSRTLILINGKRKNLSALLYTQTSPGRGETGADISAIPTDAIKRVEILRDGASAQYGSDAIAGVMNIILKDNAYEGSATLRTGITGHGDGATLGISVNNGTNLGQGKGYLNYTIDLSRVGLANRPGTVNAEGEAADFKTDEEANDPILFNKLKEDVNEFLSRKPDAGNINGSPETTAAKFLVNGGIDLNANAELYWNAAYVYKKVNSFANYRTPYWRRLTDFPYLDEFFNAPGTPGEYDGYVPTFDGNLDDYNGTVGFKAKKNGWNYDLSLTVGGNRQTYRVRNTHNRNVVHSPATWTDYNKNGLVDSAEWNDANRNGTVDPAEWKDVNGDGVVDEGEWDDIDDDGVRDPAEWNDANDNDKVDPGEWNDANGDGVPNPNEMNQSSQLYRENSPISFDPGGTQFTHMVGNIDISKALSEKVSVGFGSEFRSETFEVIAGELASYDGGGADSFAGNEPQNSGIFNRYNFGGYFDIAWDVSKNLLLNGTVRLENYSDFGEAFVWKVSTRYKLLDEAMTLRASFSTGFRAPTLHQIYTQKAQYSFVPGAGIQVGGLISNISPQAQLLGIPKLKPEKSINFTGGIGYKPTKNLTLTLDYYNIAVEDRIVLSTEIGATPNKDKDLDKVLEENNLSDISFFVNALNTRTSGLDFVANYKNIRVGQEGYLGFSLSGNYTLENARTDDVKNPALVEDAGQSVVNATQEALFFTSRPRTKWILGINYEIGAFSFSLNNTFFGKTTYNQQGLPDGSVFDGDPPTPRDPNPDYRANYRPDLKTEFKPKIVTDLSISVTTLKKLTIALNLNNLLNVLPEWEFIAENNDGTALLNNPAELLKVSNAITFNQRYSRMTYDGYHFSQLGSMFNLSLNYKF